MSNDRSATGIVGEGEPFARIDHDRTRRCGHAEVVFAAGKTLEQNRRILAEILAGAPAALATRVPETQADALRAAFPEHAWYPQARAPLAGRPAAPQPALPPDEYLLVVAAGTSDLYVAEEAEATLAFHGLPVRKLYDVGVAGLHRLLAREELLRGAAAIVVVAGMEGALASVVGGLVSCPVVATPTSVGYGASFGGLAALLAMLNGCAAGVTVVNIDNGFGAAMAAAAMVRAASRLAGKIAQN